MSRVEGTLRVSFERRVMKLPKKDISPMNTMGEKLISLAKSTAEGAKNVPK